MITRLQLPAGTVAHRRTLAQPCVVPRARQHCFCFRFNLHSRQLLNPVRATGPAPLVYAEGYKEVEEVAGARLVFEADTPKVEYLIKWKDGSEDTWELGSNLSEDLVRDFEEKWWTAARKADVDTMIRMLGGARELLAAAVDENRRSALHFSAALGSAECAKLLVEAGADVDLQDREGFTPLHMAAGYMHTSTMTVLLEAGANPEIKDNNGRDVVSLIENLRASMPLSMGSVQRRLALEEVGNCLTDRLYDEVEPSNILNMRVAADGSRDFLVSFPQLPPAEGPSSSSPPGIAAGPAAGVRLDDEWLPERNVASDLVEDYLAGLEYAEAEEVLDVVQVRTERRFKVKWSDGYPTSWEPEEHVPPELIALFAQQNPQLFSDRTSAEASSAASGWEQLGLEYETQSTPLPYMQTAAAAGVQRQQGLGEGEAGGGDSGRGGNGGEIGGESVAPQREAVGAAR